MRLRPSADNLQQSTLERAKIGPRLRYTIRRQPLPLLAVTDAVLFDGLMALSASGASTVPISKPLDLMRVTRQRWSLRCGGLGVRTDMRRIWAPGARDWSLFRGREKPRRGGEGLPRPGSAGCYA
jgi:hypothetical protein